MGILDFFGFRVWNMVKTPKSESASEARNRLVPFDIVWYCFTPFYTVWYRFTPFGTVLHRLVPFYTVWYRFTPFGTVLLLMNQIFVN